MRLETISTGDELVRGRSTDTNAPYLATRLAEVGVLRSLHTAAGDDLLELARVFGESARRSDHVVVTGGLGPTEDDYTRRAAARAAGVELVLVPELLDALRRFYRERGSELPEASHVQAYVPDGATPIANPLGTAPGFRLELHGATMFFLSGVPREMEVMFEASVLPAVARAGGAGEAAYCSLATFGRPEAWVGEKLADLMRGGDVAMGLTAVFGTIRVTIQAVGTGAEDRVSLVEREVRDRLGRLVLEGPTLQASVADLLSKRGFTLAAAESCTGGLIAKLLTDVPGVSESFRGGVVAYANEAKEDLLGVPRQLLLDHGAVSEPVARAMAEGARRVLGADLAVSVTGIAGPGGGTEEKPVGLVYIGLATPEGTSVRRRRLPGDREFVRRFSGNLALGAVLSWLRQQHGSGPPAPEGRRNP